MDDLFASVGRAIEAMPPALSAVLIVFLSVGFLVFAARREAKANEAKKAEENAGVLGRLASIADGVDEIQEDVASALDAIRRLEGSVEILKDRTPR